MRVAKTIVDSEEEGEGERRRRHCQGRSESSGSDSSPSSVVPFVSEYWGTVGSTTA